MSENNQLAKTTSNPVAKIKSYLSDNSVKARFEEMLGKRAGAFTNSIINVVRASDQLVKCTPESVVSSAMVAATLNLPIDPAIGHAAIVPYGNKAAFQIMYKGVTQLCIRSGQYKNINAIEIYADELLSWNPITEEIRFTDQFTWKMRQNKKPDDVVGYYAMFKLTSGFEKCDFMTTDEAMAHAREYSKSYQRDLREKKKSSKWSTDPIPMGRKTVLLRLLTRYGVMSIEMQEAFIADHEDFEDASEKAKEKIESETGQEVIDVTPEPEPEPVEQDPEDFMKV